MEIRNSKTAWYRRCRLDLVNAALLAFSIKVFMKEMKELVLTPSEKKDLVKYIAVSAKQSTPSTSVVDKKHSHYLSFISIRNPLTNHTNI